MERGMKLACAFEMLYARNPSARDEPACFPPGGGISGNSTGGGPVGAGGGGGWDRYESSLVRNGYYRDELEGSALYKRLRAAVRRAVDNRRFHACRYALVR